MRTVELLSELRSKDIKVWAEGDRLSYDAPKGALTSDLREELVNRKAEILALLHRADTATSSAALPLKPVSRDRPLALSFAQQRLWFLDRLEPGQSAFNLAWAVGLTGGLEVGALEQALSAIVDRHEVLRTTFAADEGGEPTQVIAPAEGVELEHVELTGLAPAERDAELQRQMGERAIRPFDLATGPVLRATLYRLAPEEHVLALTVHHIAFDGWSFGVLARELGAFYTAFVGGREPALPALPIQYADYAMWQREWLQGEGLEAQLEYWRRQLGPELTVLELPTDHPRPAQQSFSGARESYALSESLLASLRSLSQREGVTLFMTLAAGLKVLFHRYSGQSVITIGTPVANRTRSELEPLIGFFVNSLVLSTELGGELSFREALARVREVSQGAYAHLDLPFEQLVEAVRPQRDLSRHPLFQVMVALQNVPFEPLELPGLTLSALPVERPSSQFDLTLAAREGDSGLNLYAVFNTDLFERETIRRMLRHYETLLAGVVADPEQAISQLPLLSEGERQQLLVEWNRTERAYPRDATIQELFEAQVARTPEAAAVVFGEEELTYAQLNGRANQLADVLQQQGVGPDTLVGLCVERSLEMLVGLLGILKAGAAYVPLDPTYPPDRLHFMIDDAQMPVIVTHRRLPELLHLDPGSDPFSSSSRPTLVDLDAMEWKEEGVVSANPISAVTPQDLMYVIYTSGSTGKPKGVMITHRTVGNFLHAMQEELTLTQQDTFLALTSISFDISVLELFGPLLVGGCVHLISRDTAMDGTALVQALTQSEASLMQATPVTWQLLLDSNWQGSPGLRALCGGEALAGSLGQALLGKGVTLWNMYGPTETTVWSTLHRVSPDDHKVPIGRPIANTQLYVLDAERHLVPVGVAGELYIGGDGLSLGYWRREELTREKFIPHPFSQDPQARLYRTGDRVRYRADGTLEFLGRVDHQVKLRGFRIELGEIEAVLTLNLLVQEAAVLLRDEGPGGPQLVGYLLTSKDTVVSTDALRSFLRERLPEYMVPSAWVGLDAFPLTPNGKIDRKALPPPDAPWEKDDLEVVAPRTPIEVAIAAIWKTVLKLDQVGIHDNFFDLGGHSLLATQVMSRVRESFAVNLPLRLLFEAPTVAGLAAAITNNEEPSPTGSLAPIQPLPLGAPFPLSFSQERMWFLYQFAPTSAAYNISQAIYFPGPVDFDALEQAVNEIRRRHDVLRTVFPAQDGYPVPQIHPFSPLSIPVKDFRDCPDETQNAQARRFASAEAQQPFDMARGPLMRVVFLRMQADQVIVLLTLHHIITDGWSAGLLLRELETLYEAIAAGQPSALEDLSIQYQDFAAWQRGWLQGEFLDAQLTYWTQRLAGAPMILDLPLDRPRGAMQTFDGGLHIVRLPRELTVGLTQLTQQEDVTLFMALLASFSILLGRYTASQDLLVGAPIANRHYLALEPLIGTFVNTLVLRTQLKGNPTFLELLHQVRHTTLDAYAHQDLPFEVLVDAMQPPRDLSRSPVFQVMLSVLNFQEVYTTGKKKFSGMAVDRQAAQFDLTLAVGERSDDRHGMAWTYNTDLFEHATIERMSAQFVLLLEEVIADPHRRIHDYTLLPDHERQQLLVGWNATAQPSGYPGQCLPAVLEKQAAEKPDSTAVVFEGQAVTYGHLNQRANQLAHYLRTLGVGPDVRVAVHCERSLDMVLAVWGVVKAGGAYVPLDPTYPRERVALMLEDAGATVVLAQQQGQYTLPPHAAKVVWMDADRAAIEQQPRHNPSTEIIPENLAYMIYTSGSTGKPKGVQIPHRALMNFLETMARAPGMDASDRLLAVTSLSFDIAGLELFLPVLVGGQVVLASREMAADGMQLIECLNNEAITVMQATPVTWQLLLAQGWTGQPGLRVLCGGEQISLEVARQLLDRVDCLWNLYGPTETTVWSAVLELDTEMERISIGRPIANTQCYLEDPWGHPVPIGAAGELCIGGDGVARGYWNRPDLTARQFVPDPYSEIPGKRMYRTGDSVHYRPDGRLEWLARMDNQIKLRGYRIELGEIEAVLRRQPAVSEAVVLIRTEGVGDGQLVAYVSIEAGHSFDQAGLRESLQKILPGYMVPSVFIGLEAFPLTPNGKIDRKALPAPEADDRTHGTSYVAPRTGLEEILVEVWQDVLQIDRIGIHDNFFELGGHSLSATRVIARLRNELDLDIPLRSIFEYPVIEQLTLDITVQLADISLDSSMDGS